MTVRIKDIADELGISKTTVSRALRDHPDLRKATKQLVLEKAKTMGYEPNYIAKALSTKQTFTIGVILPHIRHTFFAEAINGIEDVLRAKGYSLLMASSNEDADRELENLRTFISKRVDGLLISISAGTEGFQQFKMLRERGVPTVFFDRIIDDPQVSSVCVNHEEINELLVKHLYDLGARDIMHLGGPSSGIVGKRRLEAFRKAMQKFNMVFSDENLIDVNLSEKGGIEAFEQILRRPQMPDAINTSASMQALGILKAAKDNGIRIPHDVKLTGYHVTPITEMVSPRITGVSFSIYDMGRKAAQLLLEQITHSDDPSEPQRIFINTSLEIRESSQL